MSKEMKDSGIQWAGAIPENWKIEKGKYCFKQQSHKGNKESSVLLSPTQKYGVIPQDMYEELSGFTAVKLNENINLNQLKTVHKGAFVISLRSFQGGFEYSEYEGVVSPAYQVFYPSVPVCDFYYKYLFKIPPFIDEMNSFTMSLRDGKNIAFSDFGNTYVPVPPIEEQTQIANYLNSKCSEIDSLTDDIQTQITTLEEYKKSLITEVVTKGLDSNVEMKDSGIEWVGEIPASWEIWPIYHYFNERKNKNKLMRETNLLSLSYGNVIRKDINSNGGLLPENFSSYNIIEPCDIVIRPTDLQNDKRSLRTGYVNEHGIITSAYITLKPKACVNSKYYHYLLHAYDLMKVFYNMGNGVRQGLNYNEFSKLLLVSPPKNEQDDIVNYLNSKCSEIDAIIQTKKEQLDVLAEYKKSLIYEYVTGKKEVLVNE